MVSTLKPVLRKRQITKTQQTIGYAPKWSQTGNMFPKEIGRTNYAKERNNNDLLSLSADPVSFRWFKIFGLFYVHALKISIRI